MKVTSIKNKMVMYFVSVSLVSVGILGILSYLQTKDALVQRTFDQLTSVKVVKTRQLDRFFSGTILSIENLAATLKMLMVNQTATDTVLSAYLHSFIGQNSYCSRLYIKLNGLTEDSTVLQIDGKGIETLTLSSFKTRGFFIRNGTGIYEKADSNSKAGYMIYSSLSLSPGSGSLPCFIVIEIDPATVNSIMLEYNPADGVGKSVESYLTGGDGLLRTKSRFFENSVMRTKVNSEGHKNAFMKKSGESIYKDYRNIDILGSYSPYCYSGLNWAILVEIDVDEAYAPIYSMLNNLIFYMIGISAVIILFTYSLSRIITIPVKKLTEASMVISSGHYPEPVAITNEDEIGLLTATFNEMTEKLKKQEKELEDERLRRSSASIDASDEERKRLSRELHDGLGQSFIAIKLKLENIDPEQQYLALHIIRNVRKDIDRTIAEIRDIANGLTPAVLLEFGIVNALRNLCEELNENSNIEVSFKQDYHAKLNSRAETYLFRIAQEALQNIVKHSGATKAFVSLVSQKDKILLSIKDNGRGFDTGNSGSGNGLFNIKERTRILGGTLSIGSVPNEGTEIIVTLSGKSYE